MRLTVKKLIFLISIFIFNFLASICAQKVPYVIKDISNEKELEKSMQLLAQEVIRKINKNPVDPKNSNNYEFQLINLFMAQIINDQYEEALQTINLCRDIYKEKTPNFSKILQIQYETYLKGKINGKQENITFEKAFKNSFYEAYNPINEKTKLYVPGWFTNNIESLKKGLDKTLESHISKDSIMFWEAKYLCRTYIIHKVYKTLIPLSTPLFKAEEQKTYIVEDSVSIKMKDGGIIPARVVRKRGVNKPLPTVFLFNVYAKGYNIELQANEAALNGYVGVIANLRGQRFSEGEIIPFENDANDAYEVIDWISKQSWSNGEVGMLGGSYLGFTQWAATKKLHPALKTIVPMVSVVPGFDSSGMENGIQNPHMLSWLHFVANKKTVDEEANNDYPRWNALRDKYYKTGIAYRSLDSLDGHPKKLYQRWLDHPSFDKYWQNMIPHKKDFAKINIPVLSTTGYYDGAQKGAMYYLEQHYKYNKNAEHYLIIGPYDHISAQNRAQANIGGYNIDKVANIDLDEIAYKWLDYILKDGPKPEILKDKINFQVMGANEWRHTSTLNEMNNDTLKFYFSTIKSGINFTAQYDSIPDEFYSLSDKPINNNGFHSQEVDFKDRENSNNYFTRDVINKALPVDNGISFISNEITQPFAINGSFTGTLKATINKKDFDCSVSLYELTAKGEYFKLSHYVGRSSYAKDKSKRHLLKPGKKEEIPIGNTRMVSRQIEKGSKLVVVLNVNKHPFEQINYGTGKDVSNETINDAKEPLKVQWHSDSFILVPIFKQAVNNQ